MAMYQFYLFMEPEQLKPPLLMQLKIMYVYTSGSGAARQRSERVYTRIVLMVLYYNSGIGHRKWDGAVNSGIDVRIVGLMHE